MRKMYGTISHLLQNRIWVFYVIFIGSCQNRIQEPRLQLSKEVYQNGYVQSKGALINGKRNGLWTFYNEDGNVRSECLYYNDSLCGQSIAYFKASGDTLSIGSYINGSEDGEWRSFYGNNILARKAYYNKGEKIGIWEYYAEDGRVVRRVLHEGGREQVLFEKE
ncbi:toxin-antitoxin system YwqK family antitoxin [Filimonas effusa]|nr:hypothetical protein [Filimonas effusa]